MDRLWRDEAFNLLSVVIKTTWDMASIEPVPDKFQEVDRLLEESALDTQQYLDWIYMYIETGDSSYRDKC